MRIRGRTLGDHIRLLGPLFMLLAAVFALRWILALAGAPRFALQVVSTTAAVPVAILLAVMLIHLRRFGSYANVVVASLLLNAWIQLLICSAIVLSIVTGVENIYTQPEYSLGGDPRHLRHLYGHVTFGIGIGTLIGAAVGALLLFLMRRLVPLGPAGSSGEPEMR